MSGSITIASNLAALRAQRSLAQNTSAFTRTMAHLSSGLRINSAADDAAGLAISSLLGADVRVMLQAGRNVNDGISALSIADGAVNELTNILTRLKELSEQSANGVYSARQRSPLQAETDAISNEYNRLLAVTHFNGRALLSGSDRTVSVLAGYGRSNLIEVTIGRSKPEEESAIDANTIRASVNNSGTQGNGVSRNPSISSDGRFVAFSSSATNLVTGDTNSQGDIFVHDQQTGQTTRVSVNSSGTQANNVSSNPSISSDGRYVTFSSSATNLVAGDTNGQSDIFVHDRQTGQTTRVSIHSSGTQGNGASSNPKISSDGGYVTFTSSATNLVAGDTNGVTDIFVHDRQTGQTTRVSVHSSGTQGNAFSNISSISSDGRYVAFHSSASNLVAGDTNGSIDVFVHDRQTGQTTRTSIDSSGTQGNGVSSNPSVSGDGRYVAFYSDANNLVAGDTSAEDVFVHDRQTGQTTKVSVDSSGTGGNNISRNPSISSDGRYVAFYSDAGNLVAGDTNGLSDIFVHDRQTGQTTRVSLESSGSEANNVSFNPSISSDGQFVAYYSAADNLVAGDTNGTDDVFISANTLVQQSTVSSSGGLTPLSGIDVSSRSAALASLDTLNTYFQEVSAAKQTIGSAMSRFSTAASNIGTMAENFRAAESRITDVDVSYESAAGVASRIRQNAAATVLAQANRQPQIALQLLGQS